MSENEMGYRGSKSVYIKDTVKEQRVDGSCRINSKFMLLRCTLMGGESRYPVKIPSNQINIIKYYSSNSYSAPTKVGSLLLFAITPLLQFNSYISPHMRRLKARPKFPCCLCVLLELVFNHSFSFFSSVACAYNSKSKGWL
jgi:hypothetical protein